MSSRLRRAFRQMKPEYKYLWRIDDEWNGEPVTAGSPVPKELADDKVKLAMFLASRIVIIDRDNVTPPDVDTVEEVSEDPQAPPADFRLFSALLGLMDWPKAQAPAAKPSWADMSHADKMKLARENGYKGPIMKADALNAFLAEKVG